jgi:PAS domain S-box-containing protein
MLAKNFSRAAEASAADAEAIRFGRRLVGIFLWLAAGLALAAYGYLAHRQVEARAQAHREVSAIADLKLKQIINWQEERRSDARFFSRARFVAQDLRRLLDEPDSEAARSALAHWLDLLKGGDRYSAVIVFDSRLGRLLAPPGSAAPLAAPARKVLEEALHSRSVTFGDLRRDDANGAVYLDIAFPVFEGADIAGGSPLGAVLLQLDARQFLFPLIQSWPAPSKTAETLLVRREGDDVLFLNDLRHSAGTALTLRKPLASAELPAAKILRGDTNVLEGVDYRGQPVVAAGRLVPGTPWAMVAKVDREEVYAPLRQQTFAALEVLGSLLLAAALLVGLLWRHHSARFLERELAERKTHERALARMNRLYAALSQVNGVVVRSGSRDELLRAICRVLVESGGFQMAWAGWVDPATNQVVPLAHWGDETGYLGGIRVYADERPEGHGPIGTAIRKGRACVWKDLLVNPNFAPWREAAGRAGWRSLAAFPIREEGQVRGALAVYSGQADFFGVEEQALLEEAAGDVSFGLDTMFNNERRKQAEVQLQLQAAALHSAANAIVITDRQGVIQWVNVAFERLTGHSAAEAVGQTPRLLKSGCQPPGFFKTMWETILAGHVWHGELVNKRKNGSLYFEEMTVTPVLDGRGEIAHFIAIKLDVSERKRAEDDLREAKNQLARYNAELEQKVQDRTAQLVEANSNLKTFTYTAAHDLRAPLRSMKSFSNIVLEDFGPALGAEGRSMLERVTTSADHMGQLLDDLLEYSRMSQADLKLEPVSLEKAAGESLQLLDGDIRSKNAVVTVTKPLPDVMGHAATVVLLVNNLVSNALKFIAPGVPPQIRIWAESSAGYVRLSVQDNGIGIDREHLEQIFGAFQRLHGRQAYPGTGLGLAIVRKGAERMGGRTGVESTVGKGSRFWIDLRPS